MVVTQLNMRLTSVAEYLDYMGRVGDALRNDQIGKIIFDVSQLSNFDLGSRAAAVKEFNSLVISKAPFFVLAVIRGKSMFENFATQAAIATAKPISKKFLDGKTFDTKEEAIKWLLEYEVPREFLMQQTK